jgi:hypothetical protein
VDSTETPGFFLIYFIFKNNSTGKKHAMLLEKMRERAGKNLAHMFPGKFNIFGPVEGGGKRQGCIY